MESSSAFAAWTAFYTITGSSAAALVGLMFVVLTLVGSRASQGHSTTLDGISAFSTPTVVHFSAALLLSATLCAPWHSLTGPAIALVAISAVGLAYVVRAMLRARRMTGYQADAEDWFWYSVAPLVTYGILLVSACALVTWRKVMLYAVAAVVVTLILIGIRNSWDIVTYVAVPRPEDDEP